MGDVLRASLVAGAEWMSRQSTVCYVVLFWWAAVVPARYDDDGNMYNVQTVPAELVSETFVRDDGCISGINQKLN